jgi:hypothetical protein
MVGSDAIIARFDAQAVNPVDEYALNGQSQSQIKRYGNQVIRNATLNATDNTVIVQFVRPCVGADGMMVRAVGLCRAFIAYVAAHELV